MSVDREPCVQCKRVGYWPDGFYERRLPLDIVNRTVVCSECVSRHFQSAIEVLEAALEDYADWRMRATAILQEFGVHPRCHAAKD